MASSPISATKHPELFKRRLLAVGLVGPLTAYAVGVDGGPIFQMLAAETLQLDPRAVGTALLLGALSVPIQIWAARIPLRRARHNARLFLWLSGVMALVTAAVVLLAAPGSVVAGSVLVVAVLAEIAVSVLYATSWHPLLSYVLSTKQREFMMGRATALRGVVMLVAVLLFGELNRPGRALFLVVLGLIAIAVGWSLHVLPPPPDSDDVSQNPETTDDNQAGADSDGEAFRNIFIALPAIAFSNWPLLVFYAAKVLWPGGNLGYLAGAIALGGIAGSALWRDPEHHLFAVLKLAAAVIALCSVAIVVLPNPIDSTAAIVALLAVTGIGGAARATMGIGINELAHRRVTTSNSVRIMTMMDVVGSTSFQVGGFVAGFLISASIESSSAVDPYEIWLLVSAVALVIASARFRDRSRGRAAAAAAASGELGAPPDSRSRPASSSLPDANAVPD